ncbi:MAG: TonB-dependent receptor, partial [Halioglobus sp.]
MNAKRPVTVSASRTIITATSAFTLSLCTPWVAAQGNGLALEEVIVTATKRESNLQDVAVAVTALGESLIRDARITTAEDLTFLVPSLNLQRGGNARSTSFSIRGIGTQSFSSAVEPSVSTMLDGVVLGRSAQAFMQLLDIERVEVLRGPQGTLFGKNSTGGVVHIITKKPSDSFTAEVMGSVVEGDEYRAGVSLSGPITDNVGYRMSAVGTSIDGYTRNVFDGNDYNGEESISVRGKLRWLPTDNVEVIWASDYSERDSDGTASPIIQIQPFGGNEQQVQDFFDLLDPVVVSKKNTQVNINKIPFNKNDQSGHSLEINWDIDGYTLTSISALRKFEVNTFGDLDNLPIDSFGADQFGGSEQEQFTQEIRIASPASDTLNYVAGAYYFDQKIERTFQRQFEIIAGSPGVAIADFEVDTRNWALFGEMTWALADNWRLIVGARYTEDELDFTFERSSQGPLIGIPKEIPSTPGGTSEEDLSGKLVLQWDFTDEGMAYVSYAQGYKGPAFDVAFGIDPVGLERVEPETSDSYEIGFKNTFW